MTRETRVRIDPQDVTGIVLTCRCGGKVVVALTGKPVRTPDVCPQCSETWRERPVGTVGQDSVDALGSILRQLTAQNAPESARYRVSLELAPEGE